MMKLHLYKNFPINDYANQCYYSSESVRDKDFEKYASLKIDELASCNKSDRTIRLNINYYHGNMYNYGCLIEGNKKYYIFIDSVEWTSNLHTVILHYSYDYWQTYAYDVTFKESFVEREHVADDTFGSHIIDEGLPVDEYKVSHSEVLDGGNTGMFFCISCSDTRDVLSSSHSEKKAIPSTCKPSKYERSTAIVFSDNINLIDHYIKVMIDRNRSDSISGVYAVPKISIPTSIRKQGYGWDTGSNEVHYVGNNEKLATMNKYNLPRPSSIDGYTPVNNKCFTYPYCFANFTNNNGNSVIGQFELANDKKNIEFEYYFPCIQGSVSFGYLAHYDGVSKNFDYSIQGQTNIELPYVTNSFSAYMSANQNSIANQYDTINRNELSSVGKGGISFISNLATGNFSGMINDTIGFADTALTSYNQREKINASLKDIENKANVAHGAYTGVANIICGQIGFKGQLITVNSENIKMIDDYFSMFGYKINRIKKPQFTSRKYWNYVKTSGVNLVGNVPQNALNVIKQMFDNGVTMWHNLNYFYKYDEYKRSNK